MFPHSLEFLDQIQVGKYKSTWGEVDMLDCRWLTVEVGPGEIGQRKS